MSGVLYYAHYLRLVVLGIVVGKIDADIVVFVPSDGGIFDIGLSNVLDDVKECQVGSNGHPPRHESLRGRNVLAIEIQCQFRCTGVIKETIVVFHELKVVV